MIKKLYYQLQLKWLMTFRPVVLFEKINQLSWYKKMLHQWVDDQKFHAKSEVLEVGCATGALTAYIASSGCIPTAVDRSSEMIETAKLNNAEFNYLVADVLDLPLESSSFDAVIATSLINIVDDKNRAMNELSRTCKNGGSVSILVPSADFNDKDLLSLHESLDASGFSYAALDAWHKNPPKMQVEEIFKLFKQADLMKITTKKYLHGMVIAASATKSS